MAPVTRAATVGLCAGTIAERLSQTRACLVGPARKEEGLRFADPREGPYVPVTRRLGRRPGEARHLHRLLDPPRPRQHGDLLTPHPRLVQRSPRVGERLLERVGLLLPPSEEAQRIGEPEVQIESHPFGRTEVERTLRAA